MVGDFPDGADLMLISFLSFFISGDIGGYTDLLSSQPVGMMPVMAPP